MGIAARVLKFFKRRNYLNRQEKDAARELESSAIAEVAPDIVEAMHTLRNAVARASYDAMTAAHDTLIPFAAKALANVRSSLDRQHERQAKALTDLARRCGEEVSGMHKQLREHVGQLASLRQIYTEQQERTRRLEEGYDWTITKQFCFRFIRILDSLAERIDTLPEEADEAQRRQLRELHDEVLFALEASGIEQFTPEKRSPFAGNEKRFQVVGKTTTEEREDHGLVSRVLSPGYLLSQEGRPDRILRPAHVEVFETMQLQEAAR